MKKYLLLLLILPSIAFAQAGAEIYIQTAEPGTDSCTFKYEKYFIDEYDTKETSAKSALAEAHCAFKTSNDKPEIAWLNYKKQTIPLFLEPTDAVRLTISKDSLYKAIAFSGKGSEQNTFLASFYATFHNDFDKEYMKQLMLTNTIDAFEMKLFDERKKQSEFYNKQDKSKFSKAFTDYLEQTIRYNYFANLLAFPVTNANQSTSILTVNSLPEVMLDEVNSKLFNEDALICPCYRDFITNYVIYFTSKANGFNKFTDYNTSMERKVLNAKTNLSGKTEIWYIANFLNNDCDKVAPYTVKLIYGQLNDLEKGGTYTKLLKTKCEARINTKEVAAKEDKTKTGTTTTGDGKSSNPFEGVELKDITGKVFNPKDIAGKVVFVDFWASWCGPCRQEFPSSKLLHERFTEKQLKNIVFLYISIDGNEVQWKNAVQVIGMNGLLLISPGDWGSPIVKYFGINGIPRYMLIDKNGKISNPNAPRPSSGDVIYNEILKLLN